MLLPSALDIVSRQVERRDVLSIEETLFPTQETRQLGFERCKHVDLANPSTCIQHRISDTRSTSMCSPAEFDVSPDVMFFAFEERYSAAASLRRSMRYREPPRIPESTCVHDDMRDKTHRRTCNISRALERATRLCFNLRCRE